MVTEVDNENAKIVAYNIKFGLLKFIKLSQGKPEE